MEPIKKTTGVDRKALLSTLWIFVLLNIIFRDFHELGRPGFLQEMMTGVVNGTRITEEMMLLGGIMIEIPILMVLLSRVLKASVNRWANLVAGVFAIATVLINTRTPDLDDIFFATIEIAALAVIIWLAWRWPQQEAMSPSKLTLKPRSR